MAGLCDAWGTREGQEGVVRFRKPIGWLKGSGSQTKAQARQRGAGGTDPRDSGLGEGTLKVETTELSVGLAVKEKERRRHGVLAGLCGLVPGQGDDSAWGVGAVNKEERAGQTDLCDWRASWTPFLTHWVLTAPTSQMRKLRLKRGGPRKESRTGAQVFYLTLCFPILKNFRA